MVLNCIIWIIFNTLIVCIQLHWKVIHSIWLFNIFSIYLHQWGFEANFLKRGEVLISLIKVSIPSTISATPHFTIYCKQNEGDKMTRVDYVGFTGRAICCLVWLAPCAGVVGIYFGRLFTAARKCSHER